MGVQGGEAVCCPVRLCVCREQPSDSNVHSQVEDLQAQRDRLERQIAKMG